MKARNLIGYLMGLILFVILIPLIMWRLSGEVHPKAVQWICFGVMAACGIGLSIWSIVYTHNLADKGAVKDTPAMEEAYKLGLSLKQI